MNVFMSRQQRNRGKHWQGDAGSEARYVPGTADSGYLPKIDDSEELPEGLTRVAPPSGIRDNGFPVSHRPANRMPRSAVLQNERRDLVVPRVYLEPDEVMDKLRARAQRMAIIRDAIFILLGMFLVWTWIIIPAWEQLR